MQVVAVVVGAAAHRGVHGVFQGPPGVAADHRVPLVVGAGHRGVVRQVGHGQPHGPHSPAAGGVQNPLQGRIGPGHDGHAGRVEARDDHLRFGGAADAGAGAVLAGLQQAQAAAAAAARQHPDQGDGHAGAVGDGERARADQRGDLAEALPDRVGGLHAGGAQGPVGGDGRGVAGQLRDAGDAGRGAVGAGVVQQDGAQRRPSGARQSLLDGVQDVGGGAGGGGSHPGERGQVGSPRRAGARIQERARVVGFEVLGRIARRERHAGVLLTSKEGCVFFSVKGRLTQSYGT